MEQPYLSSPPLILRDPQAARFVADPQASRFLEPFIGRERTASVVAAELGVAVSSMLYRIRQLLELRLLRVARVEARGGRPIKHYRTVADSFFVPFEATTLEVQEALAPYASGSLQQLLDQSIAQAWLDAAGERPTLGLYLSRDASGRVSQDIVPDPLAHEPEQFFEGLLGANAPAVWDDTWGSLRLTRLDAKALQRELAGIIGRYQEKAVTAGGDAYILRLAMAPLQL